MARRKTKKAKRKLRKYEMMQKASKDEECKNKMKCSEGKESSCKVYPVLVVGAGPSSLACVSALLEPSIYDHSHQRNEALNKAVLTRKDICIVDASSGSWMGRWKSQFKLLEIPKLRSIMNHHPDPFSEDSMIEYAILKKNINLNEFGEALDEFFEEGSSRKIKKQARRTVSRIRPVNNADRYKFVRPSTELYHNFCDSIVKKHQLQNRIIKDVVTDVVPDPETGKEFKVHLKSGKTLVARNVVLAVGNTCIPRLPVWAKEIKNNMCEHIWDVAKRGVGYLRSKVYSRSVVVIGGGLSAVQSARLCLRLGATSITLMARRKVIVRDFDVPVSWFGSSRHVKMCEFLQTACPEERLKLIKTARGLSTVPKSRWREFLSDEKKYNRLKFMAGAEVNDAKWDSEAKCWLIKCNSENSDALELHADYILLATGSITSLQSHPLLGKVREHTKPNGIVGGFPILTKDLRWDKSLNLFVTGGYAALQLGPTAHILAGARRGASILREAISEETSKKIIKHKKNLARKHTEKQVEASKTNSDRKVEFAQKEQNHNGFWNSISVSNEFALLAH